MTQESSYWTRTVLSRRTALRTAAAVSGLGALSLLVGCGGGDDSSSDSGGSSTGQTTIGKGASDPSKKLDYTKGKPGGTLTYHLASTWTDISPLLRRPSVGRILSLTNTNLLRMTTGVAGVSQYDTGVEPDLAMALPEISDPTVITFKLRDAQFSNGRTVTSEDVKYTYDRYVTDNASAFRGAFSTWYDRIETPDAKTVVLRTKKPYADVLLQFNGYYVNILAKEHMEAPNFKDTTIGTGPYVLTNQVPSISATFKRNPNYYGKPVGYFDEIRAFWGGEDAKRLADVVAGNIDIPFWFGIQERELLKQSRPDMTYEVVQHGGDPVLVRTDQAPFNDIRVRQALSMSIDRNKLSGATAGGEGEWDSQVQIWYPDLGSRPVKDIPGAAKFWELNIAEAKKLLAAAGITSPLEGMLSHNNSSGPTGQALVDKGTLILQGWKENGIGNFKQVQLTGPESSATINVGKYDGLAMRPGPAFQPSGNTGIWQTFWAPETGALPTTNQSHYNNPKANALLDKLITTFDAEARKKTFREIEELLATEQPQIHTNTFPVAWFYNPKLVNVRVPMIFGSSASFAKWWWA